VNELRGILADAVERLLGDHVTKEALQAAEEGMWPAALWDALEAAGLAQPLAAGGTWSDAFVVLRAAGRFAAPVPLAETVLAGWLCAAAGLEAPPGPLTVAPVVSGEVLELAHGRLSGTASRVPWGRQAAHAVVLARAGTDVHVAVVPTAAARVTPDRNLALEPRDTLTFDGAPVAAGAPAALTAGALGERGAMARAAQMAGALELLLAQSVRYANERVQFGRPIGKFQAIQHALAVLAEHAAAAAVAAEAAFHAADRGDAGFEMAVAKVRAGEAADAGAAVAHQVHGAIGFTYEHALHFATRRLWAWRAEFGGERQWAARLGRAAIARGAAALWPDLTAR
jgi:acyl-CoA dehydrogenase